MWQSLLHLWSPPPTNVRLPCPPPAPGDPPPVDGFLDPVPVAAAYGWTASASLVAVLLAVLLCYLAYADSLNTGFVRRWYGFLASAMAAGALIPVLVLSLAPQQAMAGSCETNPLAFAASFPDALIVDRAMAGLVWAGVAFCLASLLLTRVAGWHPASRGLFHNRGCPWPRWNPFGA